MAAKKKPYGVTSSGQTVHQAMGGGVTSTGSFQAVQQAAARALTNYQQGRASIKATGKGSFALGNTEIRRTESDNLREEIEWLQMENEMLRAEIDGEEWL